MANNALYLILIIVCFSCHECGIKKEPSIIDQLNDKRKNRPPEWIFEKEYNKDSQLILVRKYDKNHKRYLFEDYYYPNGQLKLSGTSLLYLPHFTGPVVSYDSVGKVTSYKEVDFDDNTFYHIIYNENEGISEVHGKALSKSVLLDNDSDTISMNHSTGISFVYAEPPGYIAKIESTLNDKKCEYPVRQDFLKHHIVLITIPYVDSAQSMTINVKNTLYNKLGTPVLQDSISYTIYRK